jgi:hypothetical protein
MPVLRQHQAAASPPNAAATMNGIDGYAFNDKYAY